MQSYIIRYVETLKARIEPTGCSINQALEVELPRMDRRTLDKMLEAADDLRRILELEMLRRDEAAEAARTAPRCVDCGLTRDEGGCQTCEAGDPMRLPVGRDINGHMRDGYGEIVR